MATAISKNSVLGEVGGQHGQLQASGLFQLLRFALELKRHDLFFFLSFDLPALSHKQNGDTEDREGDDQRDTKR